MRICGIVAEYNPFHTGHAFHIAETRRQIGEPCIIVCCMSGDFVQRGEAALMPKHLRAAAAVASGADLVLELPAPYALQSAEGFASAAVSILNGIGVLTDLSFGAEDADPALLTEVASILLEHRTVQETLLQMKTGLSYAAARERALYARIQERSELLSRPNNILAVEYCKAVLQDKLPLTLHAVSRAGAGHDADVEADGFASASRLRQLLRSGDAQQADAYLPAGSAELLREAAASGQLLLDASRLENAMMDRLIRLSPEQLQHLSGASEGLNHRLYTAIHTCRSFDGICAAAKAKRYPLSRIRRMVLCAYLGLDSSLIQLPPPYARVLAFNDNGREALRLARKQTNLPLLTKPAHVQELSPRAQAIFQAEALCCDLYHLALPCWKNQKWDADWRQDARYQQ